MKESGVAEEAELSAHERADAKAGNSAKTSEAADVDSSWHRNIIGRRRAGVGDRAVLGQGMRDDGNAIRRPRQGRQ